MNPMVDGWMGDDWFHYGAFRQQNMDYIHDQEATRSSDVKWWTSHFDDYDIYMRGRVGGRARAEARPGTGGILAQDLGASELRRLLAAIRPWTRFWRPNH